VTACCDHSRVPAKAQVSPKTAAIAHRGLSCLYHPLLTVNLTIHQHFYFLPPLFSPGRCGVVFLHLPAVMSLQ
jgi:hypothetical protein